jgi:hypothetical protein
VLLGQSVQGVHISSILLIVFMQPQVVEYNLGRLYTGCLCQQRFVDSVYAATFYRLSHVRHCALM